MNHPLSSIHQTTILWRLTFQVTTGNSANYFVTVHISLWMVWNCVTHGALHSTLCNIKIHILARTLQVLFSVFLLPLMYLKILLSVKQASWMVMKNKNEKTLNDFFKVDNSLRLITDDIALAKKLPHLFSTALSRLGWYQLLLLSTCNLSDMHIGMSVI